MKHSTLNSASYISCVTSLHDVRDLHWYDVITKLYSISVGSQTHSAYKRDYEEGTLYFGNHGTSCRSVL
jgi:hypothetical protein